MTILSFGCCQAQSNECSEYENENDFSADLPAGDRLPEEFSCHFTGRLIWLISNNEALGTHISNVTFRAGLPQ